MKNTLMNTFKGLVKAYRLILPLAVSTLMLGTPSLWGDSLYEAYSLGNASNSISATKPEAIYVPSLWTTPSVAGNDTFRGMVTLAGGISIANGSTLTLNTIGLVGGALTFGGPTATLELTNKRLLCGADFSIDTTAGGGISTTGEGVLQLTADLTLTSSLTLRDYSYLTIDGGGNRLTLACDHAFNLRVSTGLTLRNMDLVITATAPFMSTYPPSLLNLDNVNIHLATDVRIGEADHLPVYLYGAVSVEGRGKQLIDDYGLTIYEYATLRIGSGVSFVPGRFFNLREKGTLFLDDCTFDTTTAGVQLTSGSLVCANHVFIKSGAYLMLGTGTDASMAATKILPGAYVVVDKGLWIMPG